MVTADTGGGFTLWIQALDVPSALAIAGEAEAVMKAMFAIMPEFDFLRHNLESAPMRRARHVIRKTGLDRGNLCSKRVARFQRARLCGGPGPDPAAASARGKIVIGSRGACLADRTCHANLAAQALPVKAESSLARSPTARRTCGSHNW